MVSFRSGSEGLPLNPPHLREGDFDELSVPLSSIVRWQCLGLHGTVPILKVSP